MLPANSLRTKAECAPVGRYLRPSAWLAGLTLALALACLSAAQAQATRTYRCENDSSVTYQAVPCDGQRNAQASAAAAAYAANSDDAARRAEAQARRERELADRMAAERRAREAQPAGGATHFNSQPMRAGRDDPAAADGRAASSGNRASRRNADKPFVAIEPRKPVSTAAEPQRAALRDGKAQAAETDKPARKKSAKSRSSKSDKAQRKSSGKAQDGGAGGLRQRARLNAP